MSYLHLTNTRTRTRDRTPSPRPLIRRDTKRSRTITLSDNDDDDLHDDYPYSSSHRPVKPSRALTVRNQPSQLERYNIWSDRHVSEDRDDEFERERERVYRHTSTSHHHHHDHHDHDRLRNDPEERAFRLNVAATFSRPHMYHSHHHHHDSSPPVLRRKEKFVDEGWETRERSRSRSGSREISQRDSFWGEGGFWGDRKEESGRESEDEVVRRWRRVKRTKTEEWRPLSGWRRV
ncbi:hypothetical protein CC86DRAFT_374625 [Ophiobolus disseminans]|uniref:Uncharacterized protein n=1 Tax=Ophiobolus disseminans TaxID=1469910 RepID=A0A6A6ZI24_9PLEO|nr:hypothetical protein CC86DRAFT_374625 [Ophiobolus disseminans]